MFKLYKKHITKLLKCKSKGKSAFLVVADDIMKIVPRECDDVIKSGVYYIFVERDTTDSQKVRVLSCCKTSFAHVAFAHKAFEDGHSAFVEFPCYFKKDNDALKYDEIVPNARKITGETNENKPFAILGLCFV